MKFTCQKEVILGAVQTTSKAAAAKSSIPSLEGVLMELEGNKLTVTGYNLDIGIKTDIEVNGIENGSIVINARMAGDIIRKMPSGELSFSCDESNTAAIVSRDTEFSVMCMSAEEYPNVPQVNPETSFSVPQKMLKSMIIQTKFSVAVTDNKPVLMGCKFEILDNILYVVGIDGVRIALRQEPVVYDNIGFIVPAKTLEELVHILADDNDKNVTLCIDKNQISFSVGDYIMISRLIEGEYFDYRKSFECSEDIYAEVSCRDMIELLERSMLIINDKNKNPIRCEFNGDTFFMSCTTGLGKINDRISIKYNGEPVTIGFNAKYMLDAFKACDTDAVKLILRNSTAPIIIKPLSGEAFKYLILPMRMK